MGTLLFAGTGYLVVFHSLANLSLDQPLLAGVVARFWQQPHLLWSLFAGAGFAASLRAIGTRFGPGRTRLVAPVAAIVIVCAQGALNYREQDQSANTTVRDFTRTMLDPMPPGSLFLALGDLESNASRYLQQCEGYRADIRILPRTLLAYAWYLPVVRRHYPDIVLPPGPYYRHLASRKSGFTLASLIEGNVSRMPVFLSTVGTYEERSADAYHMLAYGIAVRVYPKDASFDLDNYLGASATAAETCRRARPHAPPDPRSWEAYVAEKIADAEPQRGALVLDFALEQPGERRAFDAAVLILERAVERDPVTKPHEVFFNLGLAYNHLTKWDPQAAAKMVHWWERYLKGMQGNEPGLDEIRTILAQVRSPR